MVNGCTAKGSNFAREGEEVGDELGDELGDEESDDEEGI